MARQYWGRVGTMAALFLLISAPPSRADALKESIYVLGIHIGNANGVLFGLVNSYDTRKSAHPGAEPLLRRQIKWARDLAENLNLRTDDLTQLERDMPRLNFSDMKERFLRITERLETDLRGRYRNKSAAVFRLGVRSPRHRE